MARTYPQVLDATKVGTYAASAEAGGGYVWILFSNGLASVVAGRNVTLMRVNPDLKLHARSGMNLPNFSLPRARAAIWTIWSIC